MSMKLWHNETDTFVARDAAHATELYEAHMGSKYDPEVFGEWKEGTKPHDAEMTIMMDDGRGKVTQTIAAWIAEMPEGGMLCSTEW